MSEYARMLNTNLILMRLVSLKSHFAILENGAKKNLHYFCNTLSQMFGIVVNMPEVLNISGF